MKKNTGMKRKFDGLGRIVIPIEIREKLDINEKDPIEIYVEMDKIILRKYEPSCIFCGSNKEVLKYKNKLVCHKCIERIEMKNKLEGDN